MSHRSEKEKEFQQFVAEYSERLYFHIRRMVVDHDDADDLLQNTLVKAWTKMDSYRGESSLYTWVYRIATNEALEFLRKKKTRGQMRIENFEEVMAAKLEADVYFDSEAEEARFEKALMTLPEKQRAVFNLKYFEEMKYDTMSEILGTSVGALKASYHHAVKKIENFLKGD